MFYTDNGTSLELHRYARCARDLAETAAAEAEGLSLLLQWKLIGERFSAYAENLNISAKSARCHAKWLNAWLKKTEWNSRLAKRKKALLFNSIWVKFSPAIPEQHYKGAAWRDCLEKRMQEIRDMGMAVTPQWESDADGAKTLSGVVITA